MIPDTPAQGSLCVGIALRLRAHVALDKAARRAAACDVVRLMRSGCAAEAATHRGGCTSMRRPIGGAAPSGHGGTAASGRFRLTFRHDVDLIILPSRAEPSRAEPSRAEPSRAEPSRAEPSRAEPSRAEPSRAEPSRAEPRKSPARLTSASARHRIPGPTPSSSNAGGPPPGARCLLASRAGPVHRTADRRASTPSTSPPTRRVSARRGDPSTTQRAAARASSPPSATP